MQELEQISTLSNVIYCYKKTRPICGLCLYIHNYTLSCQFKETKDGGGQCKIFMVSRFSPYNYEHHTTEID